MNPIQAALWRPFSLCAGDRRHLNVRDGLRRLIEGLSAIVFPPACVICGESLLSEERHICAQCLGRIQPINAPLCPICGRPFMSPLDADHLCGACAVKMPPFAVARSFGVYGGVLLEAVHLFKYHERTYLCSVLADLVVKKEWDSFDPRRYDLMVGVPLHRRRLYERGFNQSVMLCREIGGRWGIEVDDTGLLRTRHTAPQIQLTPGEREKNVRGAFGVRGDRFRKKRVLLVDDVLTTGATVSECSRVLISAGAEEVGVLTVARVVIT